MRRNPIRVDWKYIFSNIFIFSFLLILIISSIVFYPKYMREDYGCDVVGRIDRDTISFQFRLERIRFNGELISCDLLKEVVLKMMKDNSGIVAYVDNRSMD